MLIASKLRAQRIVALATIALVVATGSATAQVTLNASPGPANNGGSPGWAIFFDLTATGGQPLTVTEMTTASTAAIGAQFTIEIFVRDGTGLGGPVGSGPGSSPAGWTSLGTAIATQGPIASQISLPIDIPDINLAPGVITGVAVQFAGAGPRYTNGAGGYSTFSDANLSLVTGDGRSAPFTPTGSFFTPRLLTGSVTYMPIPEPSSMALVSLGAIAGWRFVRRNRRR
jgi:hypothetical protein